MNRAAFDIDKVRAHGMVERGVEPVRGGGADPEMGRVPVNSGLHSKSVYCGDQTPSVYSTRNPVCALTGMGLQNMVKAVSHRGDI